MQEASRSRGPDIGFGAARKALHQILGVLLILGATLLVYHEVGSFEFVFDDEFFLLESPTVRGGLSWEGVRYAFTMAPGANWHPLTTLVYMTNMTLFGPDAGLHHLANLAFHAMAGISLMLLIRQSTGRLAPGVFMALLFAVHPVHVESVAWVTEVKDPLSGLFLLLGLLAWVHYARAPSARRYAVVVGTFVLGLMSKPIIMTFPAILLLFDWWPLGRLRGTGTGTAPVSRLLLEKTPFIALGAVFGIVAVFTQRSTGALQPVRLSESGMRIGHALVSYTAYLGDVLWPEGLAVFYPYPPKGDPGWQILAAGLLLIGITAAAWALRRAWPWALAGWAWYLVTLLPVIGLIQVGRQARADRYLYLPLIGLALLPAWGAPDIGRRFRHGTVTLCAAAFSAVAVLAALAHAQTEHWRTAETLWRRALSVTRDNGLAEHNYAVQLEKLGRIADALDHYREAARLQPHAASAQLDLAAILHRAGRREEAAHHARVSLSLVPRDAKAYYRAGRILADGGNVAGATAAFREALRRDPSHQRASAALQRLSLAEP